MEATAHQRLSVAIIGAGFIADYHAGGLAAAGGARLTALVGRRAERTRTRARALGIERTEIDHRAVLDDPTIDAVVVATPDATHRKIAVDALAAGKAVLLQKPMAMNAGECLDVLAAAEASGSRLSVSFMHRYFPEIRWLKAKLESGALGRVHGARIRNATPGADWADWFYKSESVAGGVVMQLGVHGIDLCRHLLGPIDEVSARVTTARPERRLSDGRTVTNRMEDNAVATYRLRSGAPVSHEMSYTEKAGCDRFRLELYTDEGTVWLRTERGRAAIFAPAVTGEADWVAPELEDEPPGAAHHRHWIEIVRRSVPADDTALAGLASTVVAEAIYRSAGEERTIGIEMPSLGEKIAK